jgi:hypothetical protein
MLFVVTIFAIWPWPSLYDGGFRFAGMTLRRSRRRSARPLLLQNTAVLLNHMAHLRVTLPP